MLTKAKTYNYKTACFEDITLLLDSGAQNSFISTTSARTLDLKITDNKLRAYVVFGGETTSERSGVTEVLLSTHSTKSSDWNLRPRKSSLWRNIRHVFHRKISNSSTITALLHRRANTSLSSLIFL